MENCKRRTNRKHITQCPRYVRHLPCKRRKCMQIEEFETEIMRMHHFCGIIKTIKSISVNKNHALIKEDAMGTSYKKLWKLLIDRDLKKKDLCKMANVSSASLTKMKNNRSVTTDVLVKICEALECDISDIMEVIPEENNEK